MLDKLDHVAVSVTDIAAAVNWYKSKFNCNVVYQDDTWAMLEFSNARLALVIPEQHPPHVAVVRSDAEIFGNLTTHRDGTRSVYVRDPFGNAVEVMAEDHL
ncbi:MAG: VOC family protein [Acidobacteriota bacterium]|nr:VOC family protein [Blastocatellia bacterium]MDW8412714.1 VOC family protein [Acidobacteriota bacterium]